MHYVHITGGVVDNRAVFDTPMPTDWPDYASWVQNDVAQIGWAYDGTTFTPPPPDPPPPPPPLPTRDANIRLDAGITAAVTVAVAARDVVNALPANFTAENFAALLAQMKVVCVAFVAMLEAQAETET